MIDSHCHLDHEPLLSNLNEVIEKSKLAGLRKILTICTTLSSFDTIKQIITKDEMIYGTFGIHPHEVKNNKTTLEHILKEVRQNEKIIGVGETGLDFYYNNSEKKEQINSFRCHIKSSIELDIPLIVHSRNAEKETFEILNEYREKKPKILMHCFTGSKDFAEKLLKLDAYFSASGIITFKNSKKLQDTFKIIPLNRLLIETDSPFLAPEPKRGERNEPSFIKYTAKKLAFIKEIPDKELIELTSNNFNKLFN